MFLLNKISHIKIDKLVLRIRVQDGTVLCIVALLLYGSNSRCDLGFLTRQDEREEIERKREREREREGGERKRERRESVTEWSI